MPDLQVGTIRPALADFPCLTADFTFNDEAMANTLTLLDSAVNKVAPIDMDIFTDPDRTTFKTTIDKGFTYILKAQYK
ncbi:hypothetical protein HDV00_006874 [Rhizophlyctis rosea]|nr:hypothetical protein HDV00_006874 [Rhizophlyctis rosea]